MRIVINSSWSDSNRVGLNGIEVYDEEGDVVSFPEPAARDDVVHGQLRAAPRVLARALQPHRQRHGVHD